MAFIDDKIYISTKKCISQKKMEIELLALVPMIMVFIIVQTILKWRKLDFEGYDLIEFRNQLFVGNNLCFNDDVIKILYETYSGYPNTK